MSDIIEDESLSTCACGRYITLDRERAPMPAGPFASNDGSVADPLPAVYFAADLLCQPCFYDARGARLVALGQIAPLGECSVCDTHWWGRPTLDPGGPVAYHDQGASHDATHCSCGRRELGCGTTD